jgi:hypothetical protein
MCQGVCVALKKAKARVLCEYRCLYFKVLLKGEVIRLNGVYRIIGVCAMWLAGRGIIG